MSGGSGTVQPMRTAFIGDIGGHRIELERALRGLGVDVSGATLPEDLTVCLVGDLVHRGPDSLGVLELVDRFLRGPDGDRFVVLLGNHETVHLFKSGGQFQWTEVLPAEVDNIIRRWYAEDLVSWAAAFSSREHGQVFASHAGLTEGFWEKLSRPRSAAAAAKEVNGAGVKQITKPGTMLEGRLVRDAGVIWAECGWELYLGWLEHSRGTGAVPFAQVHGHSTAFDWTRKQWQCPQQVANLLSLDARRRHVTGTIGGRLFAGIDPCFGVHAGVSWSPLVIADCHRL